MRDGFSYDDMIKCLEREIKLRRHVYPGLIAQHKISEEKADYELRCIAAILAEIEDKAGRRLL